MEEETVVRMVHIGKKVPKGFKELPGGIHLGKGMWILPMEPMESLPRRKRRK